MYRADRGRESAGRSCGRCRGEADVRGPRFDLGRNRELLDHRCASGTCAQESSDPCSRIMGPRCGHAPPLVGRITGTEVEPQGRPGRKSPERPAWLRPTRTMSARPGAPAHARWARRRGPWPSHFDLSNRTIHRFQSARQENAGVRVASFGALYLPTRSQRRRHTGDSSVQLQDSVDEGRNCMTSGSFAAAGWRAMHGSPDCGT